jgi:hypothetical protein
VTLSPPRRSSLAGPIGHRRRCWLGGGGGQHRCRTIGLAHSPPPLLLSLLPPPSPTSPPPPHRARQACKLQIRSPVPRSRPLKARSSGWSDQASVLSAFVWGSCQRRRRPASGLHRATIHRLWVTSLALRSVLLIVDAWSGWGWPPTPASSDALSFSLGPAMVPVLKGGARQ